jgi:hypothetical protein
MYDFGPLGAQNDDRLLEYFHITKQTRALVDPNYTPRPFIFVARSGTGKTALQLWLKGKKPGDLAVFISSGDTKLYDPDPRQNPGDLKLLMGVEFFTALISEIDQQRAVQGDLDRRAKEFLRRDWLGELGTLLPARLTGRLILGWGFTLEPSQRQKYLQKIRHENRLPKAASVLRGLAQEVQVFLVFDDPEEIVGEGLDFLTTENAIRLGALLYVLTNLHAIGVRVILFLKEQIFQNVRKHYQDYSQVADRVEGLSWTQDDLISMLEDRIQARFGTTWSDVFAFSKAQMAQQVLPLLVNGPRDLLHLCNTAGSNTDSTITLEDLLRGVDDLREERYDDMGRLYQQWPNIEQLVRALIRELTTQSDRDDLETNVIRSVFAELFSDPDSEVFELRMRERELPTSKKWIDKAMYGAPRIDEILFMIGCFGYVQAGRRVFPWESRDIAQFRRATKHFIAPLFVEQLSPD